jgi:hypothetical protein
MEPSLYTFLQESSISVITVGALVYVTYLFLNHLQERDTFLRETEKEIRSVLTSHISQSNAALQENSRALQESAEVNREIVALLRSK